MQLVVPSDPLEPRAVDPEFAVDAAAAREAGWAVATIHHDELCDGGAGSARRAVRRAPEDGGDTVYRGWMVTAPQYDALAGALAERGCVLRTRPDQYRRGHELPGWYENLHDETPASRWTTGVDLDVFADLCGEMGGPLVVRDYVKSEKHYWDEAAFVEDGRDRDSVLRRASRFVELRGDHFAGGLVARRFERFVGPETRTWWVDGRCVALTPHPDTPDQPVGLDRVPDAITAAVRSLGLGFATADLVRNDAGDWRVIEIGDGQVSGMPKAMDIAPILEALATSS